ncbi:MULTISPECIES: EAL domain-containing protein [unclassified Methylobacterium]|nr:MULTISPECIES: EAL domain-containing protein [unclassified Methylobacterium]GBU18162.1 hypothetical protein AwMethylo_23770 [Methylobacterium sp.]
MTIRGRIFVAFLAMSAITGGLGLFTNISIRETGDLAERTYDKSLMAINYARAAAADFAEMQAAVAYRALARDDAEIARLDAVLDQLGAQVSEDLGVAVERSHTARSAAAAERVRTRLSEWQALRRPESAEAAPDWAALDRAAGRVREELQTLVDQTAGDGFTYRQSVRRVVAYELQAGALAASLAVILSALVAWLLARRIIGPVAAASAAAERIAEGHLDDPIPQGGRDEMGALLRAMSAMRDNIRTSMEQEVARRRSAQALLGEALESLREGVVVLDANGAVILANARAATFLGGTEAEGGPGKPRKASRGIEPSRVPTEDGEVRLPDGSWLRISRTPTRAGGHVAILTDVTEFKEQNERFKAANVTLDAALDNMSQGLCLYDADYRLRVVNRRYGEIYNLPPGTLRLGMRAEDVLQCCVDAGNHPGQTVVSLLPDASSQGAETSTSIQHLGDGRVVAIESRKLSDGGLVATYEDITERRHAEAKVAFLAGHDALTNLPNRTMLAERIEQALSQVAREGGFALLQIDLDGFKRVNDAFGPAVGDELICAAGNRLQACAREIDTVARLGADEFVVLQQGVERPEDCGVLAKRIIEVLGAPYSLSQGRCASVGITLGISLAPGDGPSGERLLKSAAVALDRAKAESRGSFRFFEADMDARLHERRRLEQDLRDAVEAEAFEVHYQPIYDFGTERIGGFEALLRWTHPERGRVSPAEFIPLAEEIGLIARLGEWVLRQACAEAAGWPDDLKIAVNVSAVQFSSATLPTAVHEALARSGLPGHRLELEITESVLVANPRATTEILHGLKRLGVRVSMDDFGTGYSSLSYLRSFPFDKIKIDQAFVRDLCETDGSGFIVRAVIGLGASLGMTTTAEGVETREQLERLRDEGCDEAQGYLFSPPVPAQAVPGILERWNGSVPLLRDVA